MSWVFDEEVLAVIAAIAVVAGVFAISQAFYAGRVIEPFSELGLLGPAGKIGGYPKEVVAGSPFLLNVYVGNHEGKAMYYRVLVKVGDKISVVNASTPLHAEPLMDIRVVLGHNSSVIIPVNVTLIEPAVNARLIFESAHMYTCVNRDKVIEASRRLATDAARISQAIYNALKARDLDPWEDLGYGDLKV
ncbi:MAG: DUF1616 domain-containing protein, partial [Candidatus Bathyarchaeia archaeon]